jgi:ribosomal protein S27E
MNFFGKLQMSLARWMQGRYGADSLNKALLVVAIALWVLDFVFNWGALYFVALVVLVVAIFRMLSRNISQRARENAAFENAVRGPRKAIARRRKMWANRKTTRYFKCKECGATLAVPRGKGKLRTTCPKCHNQTIVNSK